MFNLARIKAHFKAGFRAVKKFFTCQSEHEKVVAREMQYKTDSPKVRVRPKAKTTIQDFRKAHPLLRRYYFGGQFSPMMGLYVQGRRVRFSWTDIVRTKRKYAI